MQKCNRGDFERLSLLTIFLQSLSRRRAQPSLTRGQLLSWDTTACPLRHNMQIARTPNLFYYKRICESIEHSLFDNQKKGGVISVQFFERRAGGTRRIYSFSAGVINGLLLKKWVRPSLATRNAWHSLGGHHGDVVVIFLLLLLSLSSSLGPFTDSFVFIDFLFNF